MGRLMYDSTSEPILIDDGELAHVKIVVATKLRRQESFMMSWSHVDGGPDGRTTIWVHPAIPLRMVFDHKSPPQIDPHRVEELMRALNASGELVLDGLIDPRREAVA